MISPISYNRVPVRELRSFPASHLRRGQTLDVLDFRLTSGVGMAKGQKPRSYGHGSARIGGYILLLCVVRDGTDWYFEVEGAGFDEWRGRRERLDLSLEVLSSLYWGVKQRIVFAEAKSYGRSAGRN